jgi:hypothetical protein
MSPNPQIDRLRSLVSDGLYPVDERAIAEAILGRASLRQRVPGVTFRNDVRTGPRDIGRAERRQVRSFRPSTRARSFHLDRRPV